LLKKILCKTLSPKILSLRYIFFCMKTQHLQFNNIVETIYNMPLDDKLELKSLLEHNIADSRRSEIAENYKRTLEEQKSGKLKFSSKISDLKKML
jgi:hypothetical protein